MRGRPDSARCGTSAGYHRHRRNREDVCGACRLAYREFRRQYRKRAYLYGPSMTDATGTRRRIQALMRLGWSQSAIGAELGILNRQVSQITRSTQVLVTTARKVAAVYDRLAMTAGDSATARHYAIKQGWPAPLDWDDELIDDPAALSYSQRKRAARHSQIVERARERRLAA